VFSAVIWVLVEWLTDCIGSQLRTFHISKYALTTEALKWLPHHNQITSLSFTLAQDEDGTSKDNDWKCALQKWKTKREIFTKSIAALSHLQSLHLHVQYLTFKGDNDLDGDNEELRRSVPPLVIASTSLHNAHIDGTDTTFPLLNFPSVTQLTANWKEYHGFATREDLATMLAECRKVTHFMWDAPFRDAATILPLQLLSHQLRSINIRESLSIDSFIHLLQSSQLRTSIESFSARAEIQCGGHILFDAILHQWKQLKHLNLYSYDSRYRNAINAQSDHDQLVPFIPQPTTQNGYQLYDKYTNSSPAGNETRWVHCSLEKLDIGNQYHIKHWQMPSLRHFTISSHFDVDHVQFNEIEMVWSFLLQSHSRLHTLEFIPGDHPKHMNAIVDDEKRNELKRITFPNLEKLIISNGYLKWLYECIDAGPYLSLVRINNLNRTTWLNLMSCARPLINFVVSPLTHPNEWHQYQPVHLYLSQGKLPPWTSRNTKDDWCTLMTRFVNVSTWQFNNADKPDIVDHEGITNLAASLIASHSRSIDILFQL
jgi:hypothetical protein